MAGSEDLRLPASLRGPLHEHLSQIREGMERRGFGGRVGFGARPAVIVIDLAEQWTNPSLPIGSDLDDVVQHTKRLLDAARSIGAPIFFTTMAFGIGDPLGPSDAKLRGFRAHAADDSDVDKIDARLARQPNEKLIVKKYASAFAGTDLQAMLTSLQVDTLIVAGCSTSHCVYATCRDAVSGYRVIVPSEAVGDRCELMHLTSILDIDLCLGDVLLMSETIGWLNGFRHADA